jgi:hypothetical protein
MEKMLHGKAMFLSSSCMCAGVFLLSFFICVIVRENKRDCEVEEDQGLRGAAPTITFFIFMLLQNFCEKTTEQQYICTT